MSSGASLTFFLAAFIRNMSNAKTALHNSVMDMVEAEIRLRPPPALASIIGIHGLAHELSLTEQFVMGPEIVFLDEQLVLMGDDPRPVRRRTPSHTCVSEIVRKTSIGPDPRVFPLANEWSVKLALSSEKRILPSEIERGARLVEGSCRRRRRLSLTHTSSGVIVDLTADADTGGDVSIEIEVQDIILADCIDSNAAEVGVIIHSIIKAVHGIASGGVMEAW